MRGLRILGQRIRTQSFLGAFAACLAAAPFLLSGAAPAPFKVIHSFGGGANDGAMPTSSTSLAAAGSTLYGVTQSGGPTTNGVLFRINANGSGFTILHRFNGYTTFLNPSGTKDDGANPTGTPVILGTTLYGMTTQGGSNGFGTIYRINTDGSGFQILHHFKSIANDGHLPQGSLVLSGTTLFGMTSSGGNNFSQGTAFRIETSGAGYQVLHHFQPGSDGSAPLGSLIVSGSTLYGMTSLAGTLGQGVLFRMNTNGSGYQILRTFSGTTTDGANPRGTLILNGSTLFGTTGYGGANNVGTVFKVETNGSGFQILHSFAIGEAYQPYDAVTLVGSKLYGMTWAGGANGLGSGGLFELGTDGSNYRLLHTFTFSFNTPNGLMPFGYLLFANSALYGMTSLGGTKNQGTVFSYGLSGGGTGTGTPELTGSFGSFKETCRTRRGVLGCTSMAMLTVQNIGTAISVPTHVRYFLSADADFDAGVDVQFGEKNLPKIKATKSKRLRLRVKTTESTAGSYLLAVDDAGDVLASSLIAPPQ